MAWAAVAGRRVNRAGHQLLRGGGFSSYNSYGLVVSNCQFESNNAALGGGANFSYHGTFDRCVFSGNTGRGSAGGMYFIESTWGRIIVRHCLIYNNSANVTYGGGVYMCNAKVQNCVIYSNFTASDGGGGIYFQGAFTNNFIENSIVWANRSGGAGIYSNCWIQNTTAHLWPTNSCIAQQGLGATYYPVNCISNDPKFVDTASTNVRLRTDSPCINAGTNREWMSGAVDLDGRRRIDHFSGIVDMGAYEYLSQGSLFTSH